MPHSLVYSIRNDGHDAARLHSLLTQAEWAHNLPLAVFERAMQHSLVIAAYDGERPIGMARLVTDYTNFAYLADVVVDMEYRGQGISKAIMEHIMSLDFVPGLRRFTLITDGASGLYAQFGFVPMDRPHRVMERYKPEYGPLPSDTN